VFVGLLDGVRHRLWRSEPTIGVQVDSLGVADEHVEDAVDVADALDVVRQRQR
jgi:hypothetical protein